MTRRPQLVLDRPGVPRRSFGNTGSSGADNGANSKRDPLPPPSYSEVEGLDLPDYRDLEFADEQFKLDHEEEEVMEVRGKADVYAVDKEIARGHSHLEREGHVGDAWIGGSAEQVEEEIRQCLHHETSGTVPKMNATEKSGDIATSSVSVQIYGANQEENSGNQTVDDTEKEEIGKEEGSEKEAKDDPSAAEQVASHLVDEPAVLEVKQIASFNCGTRSRKHDESEKGGEDMSDGGEVDKGGMSGEDRENVGFFVTGENKEEKLRWRGKGGSETEEESRRGNTWRRDVEQEGDETKDEEESKDEYVRREERGEEVDTVAEFRPLRDTVLIQNGDVRGTQV